MFVGKNWKPRKFSDAELDEIERRGNGDLEEFGAVLCRCISRMSDAEKKELRETWLGYVEKRDAERKRLVN